MKNLKSLFITVCLISGLMLTACQTNAKVVMEDIKLPEPVMTGGMSLMEALQNRHSSVKFGKEEIPLQQLSELLWAANGQNRPDGKRTTPSALNAQVITLYAALPDGIYKYDPTTHSLVAFSKEDIRPIIGNTKAPLILLYVANLGRQSKYLAAVDCGFIGQNVYLYSAANNLNTIFLYGVNTSALNYKLELKLGEEVLFAQLVGVNNKK